MGSRGPRAPAPTRELEAVDEHLPMAKLPPDPSQFVCGLGFLSPLESPQGSDPRAYSTCSPFSRTIDLPVCTYPLVSSGPPPLRPRTRRHGSRRRHRPFCSAGLLELLLDWWWPARAAASATGRHLSQPSPRAVAAEFPRKGQVNDLRYSHLYVTMTLKMSRLLDGSCSSSMSQRCSWPASTRISECLMSMISLASQTLAPAGADTRHPCAIRQACREREGARAHGVLRRHGADAVRAGITAGGSFCCARCSVHAAEKSHLE